MKKLTKPTVAEIKVARGNTNACVEGKGSGNICSTGGKW